MIEARNVTKSFDGYKAVDDVSITIKDGNVFGLIGTNGAGKSTFLRMLAGIIKRDSGILMIDDMEVFENPVAKKLLFYISDEQYFMPNATPVEMMKFYANNYENFNTERAVDLLGRFNLDINRRISTFSKGMKKQLSFIYGICAGTKYLLCDETFDGLDPVMRQGVKSLFANEMMDRDFTPIIASHNLRELEDICDHVGLLHKGGVLLSKDLESMKDELHKFQVVFRQDVDATEVFEGIEILNLEKRGSLIVATARGDGNKIMAKISEYEPVFAESLPLSLEEIFISETGVNGYDIKNIIF